MPYIGKSQVTARLCLLAFLCQICTSSSSKASSTASPSSTSTCPSRTINYITETLPQQCLRTNWSSNVTATEIRNASDHVIEEAGLITIEQPIAQASQGASDSGIATTALTETSAGTGNSSVSDDQRTPSTSSTTTTTSTDVTSPSVDSEAEADPLSDNANFLSFEDWKAQMLKKAGQSVEDMGSARQGDANAETRRRSAGVHQALDSLGDDNEIELDFPGFVNSDSMPEAVPPARDSKIDGVEGSESVPDAQASQRSKEAGTTSKERFNYASFDCAATVLKKNNECKGPNSILLENKDSYMLNPCKTKNKFFIVELCNDILIDTIALGNYEFFSSTFRTFRVSISDRYPVKLDKWRDIGTFEAQNTRGVQAFLVENGLIWARYLRIEFLTHYGNEYYCPLSILRVHGKTMIDDYRNDMKMARGEDDIDDEASEAEISQEGAKIEKITAIPTESHTTDEGAQETPESESQPRFVGAQGEADGHRSPEEFKDQCPRTNYISPLLQQADLVSSACRSTRKYCNLELTPRINATARAFVTQRRKGMPAVDTKSATVVDSSQGNPSVVQTQVVGDTTQPSQHHSTPKSASNYTRSSSDKHGDNSTSNTPSVVAGSTTLAGSSSTSKSTTQPPAPSPSTQESFFKSVHKRLQHLEANSTLSLQYIEEQSRILREAFTKVEKRQLNKTTTFLESINATVLGELREFRLQYDQIWQSTILELSSQREQSHREAVALTARMTLLADEVLWQKRLVYLQFGLILLCLGLIMFSRNNTTPYLELPALQGIVQRSSGFSRHLGFESPPGTPSRPGSRYGLFSRRPSRFRSPSSGSGKSPSTGYRSPTPPTEDEPEPQRMESPEPAEPIIRRAISSPALGQDAGDIESDENPEESDESQKGDQHGNDMEYATEGASSSFIPDGRTQSPHRVEKQARFAPPTPD